MTFKAGDKVRHKDKEGPWAGWEGTVQGEYGGVTTAFTTAANGFGAEVRLTTSNLELIKPSFTFADIQVGDKIRRTLTRESGTTEVREGVVLEKTSSFATDTPKPIGSYILAYSSDGDPAKHQVKLELLERPKEPELWENREAGDKIVTYLSDGLDRIFTKREDGLWDTLVYTSGKKLGKGFPRADQDIAAYLTKQTVTAHIVK